MVHAVAKDPSCLTFVPIEICGGIDLAMDLMQGFVCEGIWRRSLVGVFSEELGFGPVGLRNVGAKSGRVVHMCG